MSQARLVAVARARIQDDTSAGGGWLTPASPGRPTSARGRGMAHLGHVLPTADPSMARWAPRHGRRLTAGQLHEIYVRTPTIRSCIDSIVRRLATQDWRVGPKEGVQPGHKLYGRALNEAMGATKFLEAPASDHTWQQLWTKVGTDLLKYEAGVVELARTLNAKVAGRALGEMRPLRGAGVLPIRDENDVLEKYVQLEGMEEVEFEPDELLYLSLFPSTDTVVGMPLIETALDEAITLLLSSERAMVSIDADEVPPGILVVGGLAHTAVKEALDEFRNMRGRDEKLRALSDPSGKNVDAKWVEMRHKMKDVEFIDVIREIDRRVFRLFGVTEVEMGRSDDVNRSNGEVQERIGQSHLMVPILEMVSGIMTSRVLPLLVSEEVLNLLEFGFVTDRKLTPEETKDRATAQDLRLKNATRTIDEIRAEDGLGPVPGGNIPLVMEGKAWTTLEYVLARAQRQMKALTEEPEPEPGEDGEDDPDDDDDPDDGEGGSPENQAGDEEDDAPGEVEDSRRPGGLRAVEALTREQLRGWLVEHYSHAPRMSRPRIRTLLEQRAAGHHRDLLDPPPEPWAYRGLQLRRAALARLLGDSGVARSGRSPGPVVCRALAETDGARDKSWTSSAEMARKFACGEFIDEFADEEDTSEIYAAVLVSPLKSDLFLLNAEAAAREPGVGDHWNEIWKENLSRCILSEREVLTGDEQQPALLVYALRDKAEAELDGLVKEAVRDLEGRARCGPGCGHAHHTPRGRAIVTDDLPSDWPSVEIFSGYRTVDLTGLQRAISAYTRAVVPLYREARDAVVAQFRAAWKEGGIPQEESQALRTRVNTTLDALETKWAMASWPHYRDAAKLARDAAVDFTLDNDALEDFEARARLYQQRAMGYLSATSGLVGTIRSRLQTFTSRITRDRPAPQVRAIGDRLSVNSNADEVLQSVADLFDSQEHRTHNWSGKLVELAAQLVTAGLRESPRRGDEAVEWMAEWVAVGDGPTCEVCYAEGTLGFRFLHQFTRLPGGDTPCLGSCRCTLVFWTRKEVDAGEATLLSGSAPGNDPL